MPFKEKNVSDRNLDEWGRFPEEARTQGAMGCSLTTHTIPVPTIQYNIIEGNSASTHLTVEDVKYSKDKNKLKITGNWLFTSLVIRIFLITLYILIFD